MRKELYYEINLLKKYYDVDVENKIVSITLKFEKATDIIDLGVDTKENYAIKDSVMAEIVERISTIPPLFRIKLNLLIDDYEGYNHNKLLDSVNDFLEMNHYSIIRERKFFFIQAIILLAIGISILVFNGFAKKNGIIEETSVIVEVLDIVAWVFVWQATTVAFLTPSEFDVNSNKFKLRVKGIALYDKDRNLLVEEETLEKFKKWVGNKKAEKTSRILLLLSGGALLVSAVGNLLTAFGAIPEVVGIIKEYEINIFPLLLVIIIAFTTSAIEWIIAISALSQYTGRGLFYKKARWVLLPISLIGVGLELYTLISMPGLELSTKVTSIISIGASLSFFAGTIMSMILVDMKKANLNN